MDWSTIRVLTKNLGELLAQMEAGEHSYMASSDETGMEGGPHQTVKGQWATAIQSVSVSLQLALNLEDRSDKVHSDLKYFTWPPFERNYYVQLARSVYPLAVKLINDYDAQLDEESRTGRS